MRRALRNPRTGFLLIALIALLVRLAGIAARPIWYDEAFSILFAEKGPAVILGATLASATGAGPAEPHPLGYLGLLWLWMQLFGRSPAAARLLSVLPGLGTVGLAFLLGRKLFDAPTGRAAMLFVALSPFQIHYSQEIRMYALMAFWLLLATYACVLAAQSGDWRWWLLFASAAALAQYTQTLAAFYLAPLALTPAYRRDWSGLRGAMLASLAALLLYLPWLVHVPGLFAKIQGAYWIEAPSPSRLITLLLLFVTNLPLWGISLAIGLFLALSCIAIGVVQTIRAARAARAGSGSGLWLLYLAFAPPILMFVVSQFTPVYLERALLASGVVFWVWLAWALAATGLPRPVQAAALAMLCGAAALGIFQHLTYRGFPYGPFQALDHSLHQRIATGDLIVHSNKLSFLPALYFDPDLPQLFLSDPPGSKTDTLAPAVQQALGLRSTMDIQVASAGASRIWLVIFQESIDEARRAGLAAPPDLEFLQENFTLSSEETWDDLRVFLFVRKP